MKYNDIQFKSTNGINTIKGMVYLPDNIQEVKGIVQICHGMCEYIEKYERFAKFLTDNNFIVCGHSHIGHGQSVNNEDEYGFFAEKFGYKYLIKDVYKLTCIMKEKYPNLPYFVLGHSMGSFIIRCYISNYGNEIDGAIISGTGGPNQFIDLGIKFANMIIKQKGNMYRSDFLTDEAMKIVFNKQVKHSFTKYDWVSRDAKIVKEFSKDKLSDFSFTACGYRDLFNLIKYSNNEKTIDKIPKQLPIYIFSGDKDPVGQDGVGVEKVYKDLVKHGCTNVIMKLYKNGRHEMLNEINYEKVYDNILKWINNKGLASFKQNNTKKY